MKSSNDPNGNRRTLILTVTHQCNLSCIYCYEHDKSNQYMQFETAKKAVCKAFSELSEGEELEIDFHGGEPLLAFELIHDLCEWIWDQKWQAPYICFATTNGTLVKGKIKEWIEQNSERFWLGLSLDGNREMHNLNRSNSYEQIDIKFFLEKWPIQPVKMTISDKTLPFLAEGIMYLHKSGFKLTGNLAFGIDWSGQLHINEFAKQLKILIEFYLENPQFEPSGPLAMGIELINYENLEPQKWCGVGTHMVAIDVDGNEYPCHMFLPTISGDVLNGIDWKTPNNFQDDKCADCSISPICATCYGKNLIERGSLSSRDKGLCNMFKIQALACSYLKANLLIKNLKTPESLEKASELYQQIKAINKIQETITQDLSDKGIFA